LHTRFLRSSFDGSVTWHFKHVSKWDLSETKHTSSGNSIMVIANGYLFFFFFSFS